MNQRTNKMSTSTYYSFIGPAAEHAKGPISIKTAAEPANPIELHRQSAMSPSSYTTSTSNSSSSLNSQFCNSLTPNSTASSSTSTSSASSTASTTNLVSGAAPTTTTSQITSIAANHTPARPTMVASPYSQRDFMRQSSVTPTQHSGNYHQLHHSYTLHSLEPKPLKPFKSQSAYIEAMKEDLAEWLNSVYTDLELTPENFFSQLETGAIICRHANNVTQMGRNVMIERAATSSDVASSGGSDNENSLNHESVTQTHLSSPSPEHDCIADNQSNDGKKVSNQNQFYRRHRHSTTNSSISSTTTTCSSLASVSNKQRLSLTGSSAISSPRHDKTIDWFRVKLLSYKSDARPGTFFARDNICQFILWCRSLNIIECLLFETDDLVARKNEKSFILCLLEVARIGFKVGMPTPLIIQLEQEIDREIENDAKLQKQLEEDERGHQQGNIADSQADLQDDSPRGTEDDKAEAGVEVELTAQVERQLELNNNEHADELQGEAADATAREDEVSEQDFGPKPQVITNDLLSLHERVVQLLCQCSCPTQFPMVRIGDGKYKVGDKLIIFVRILRRHIMVRVGGGWQELSEFLRQKDPCRTKCLSTKENYFAHHNQPHSYTGVSGYASATKHSTPPPPAPRTPPTQTPTSPANNSQQATTPTTIANTSMNGTSIPVSRARLLGSGNHLNKSYRNHRHSPSTGGRRSISGSASMSWLANN